MRPKSSSNLFVLIVLIFQSKTFKGEEIVRETNEERAQIFVDAYNRIAEKFRREILEKSWEYQRHMTKGNQAALIKAQSNYGMFSRLETNIAEGFTMEGLDPILTREIKFIRKSSTPRNPRMAKLLGKVVTTMSRKWAEGGVSCSYKYQVINLGE